MAELAECCQQAGVSRPLFVTDAALAGMDITQKALDHLEGDHALFDGVASNPNDTTILAGLTLYREEKCDGVIGFGGGSALDAAKVIAFMSGQERPLWDFEDRDDWWTRAKPDAIAPIVAVPTTAGTGSEVGRAGVITNSETAEKKIIFHPRMLPAVVICDPDLTVGMPKPLTAGTGLDAFAHCVEAYSSPSYHPMSDGIALEGMRLVKEYLPRAYEDGNDLEARTHMMSAAMMGATAFQKGLGAIHAISHPVGAVHHTHHGTTNALFMSPVLEFNRPAIATRFEAVASYLGLKGGFDGFCDFVQGLNQSLAIPTRLADLGVTNPDINALAHSALADPCASGNPVPLTLESVVGLIESVT